MSDRFDLEQQIMKCWEITEDLDRLSKTLMEGIPEGGYLSRDEASNYAFAIRTVYEHRFQEMWNTFSELVHARELDKKK